MQSNSRIEILNKIAATRSKRIAAINNANDFEDSEIYKPVLVNSLDCFMTELEAVNGKCVLCDNDIELYQKLAEFIHNQNLNSVFCKDSEIEKQLEIQQIPFSNSNTDFEKMQVGITSCEYLIARTGSILVTSAAESGRQMTVFPPIHIVVAKASQLVDYLTDAYALLQQKYKSALPSSISTITGPSRTADIEKTLVLGAHGPKEFVVFLSKI